MYLNICVDKMAPLGPFAAAVVFGGMTFDSERTEKEVCPQEEAMDPPEGTKVFPIERHGLRWRFRIFPYNVWCAIVAAEICSESCVIVIILGRVIR